MYVWPAPLRPGPRYRTHAFDQAIGDCSALLVMANGRRAWRVRVQGLGAIFTAAAGGARTRIRVAHVGNIPAGKRSQPCVPVHATSELACTA